MIIKKTGKINLEALNAYLDNKMGWDNTVLECMSMLYLFKSVTRWDLLLLTAFCTQASSTMSFARVRPRTGV